MLKSYLYSLKIEFQAASEEFFTPDLVRSADDSCLALTDERFPLYESLVEQLTGTERFELDKEFQFLKDLIEKSSITNGEGLSSAASGEQKDIFDKLIDMLLLEIGNKEQLDRIVDDVITAVGLEDLSSNLEIIADVDEILKGLDDPDGPLDTIKTELTTLSGTATNLKTDFNTFTTTLEKFVGELIP